MAGPPSHHGCRPDTAPSGDERTLTEGASTATGWRWSRPRPKIIRDIAQQVLDGASLRSVTADLAASGVTGRNGKPFTIPSVRKILLRADDRGVPGGRSPACSSRSEEWDPILDRDTWNKLRERLLDPGPAQPPPRQPPVAARGRPPSCCGRCADDGGEPVKMASKPHEERPALLLPDLRPLHRVRPHRRGRRGSTCWPCVLDPVTWRRLRRGRPSVADSSGFEEAMATVTARFVAGDIDAVELWELA